MNIQEALTNAGQGARNKYGNKMKNAIIYSQYTGENETIKEYYESFVAPRLPEKEVVLQWHNMLKEYCKKDGAVFALRTGATAGTLRRGWFTKTDGNFSYFYTDNDFALYFYKMALDGYCPTIDEFYNAMTNFYEIKDISWIGNNKKILNPVSDSGQHRKFPMFPVHFLESGGSGEDSFENKINAYIINGPVCCIGRYQYKHSHIFDTGAEYCFNGKVVGMAEICAKYFPLGSRNDWTWNYEISNYQRMQNIPYEDQELCKKY